MPDSGHNNCQMGVGKCLIPGCTTDKNEWTLGMPSPSICKLLAFLTLLGTQTAGWAANTKLLQKVDSPNSLIAVQLQVQEGIDVGGGKPGFKLSLS